ncbi:MAG: Cytochrome b6-f complex iron-sulfur subunit [Planctomycetes bacterium]|nr:Cytochrome b6-f complex iron-sulfur subunit [Planctomycetota bacterium]
MTDSGASGPATPSRPVPRAPGAIAPRPPRAPDQRGGELEPPVSAERLERRKFTWLGLTAFFAAMGGCTVKFFFPRTLMEPKTRFKIGRPGDYGFGVDDRLQDKYRIWVCRDATKIYVISAVCTHLGCTPNWVPGLGKFKCPCHGSGYDSAGVNFEGPAPRPMDRCHVEIAPDGQIVVDVTKTYRADKDQWGKEGAFLPV